MVEQSSMRRWRTQAHEKDLTRVFVFVAVGIEIAIGRHFDIDADSEPDSDSGDFAISALFLEQRPELQEPPLVGSFL